MSDTKIGGRTISEWRQNYAPCDDPYSMELFEAFDRIAELEAENGRLRAALENICAIADEHQPSYFDAHDLAEKALTPEPK